MSKWRDQKLFSRTFAETKLTERSPGASRFKARWMQFHTAVALATQSAQLDLKQAICIGSFTREFKD
jgi:hypothetical protein